MPIMWRFVGALITAVGLALILEGVDRWHPPAALVLVGLILLTGGLLIVFLKDEDKAQDQDNEKG